MLSKTRGIVLHAMAYSDTYSIVYMYTEVFGRVAYMVARSRGKRSTVSRSLFLPLSVMEMEVDHQQKRGLQRIREARNMYPFHELYSHPVKNAIALFIAELLYRLAKEKEGDARFFDFLERSIRWLEQADQGIANFHLVFMLRLPFYWGVAPNVESYEKGACFDLLNGVFTLVRPLHRYYLSPNESVVLQRLLRIGYENMSLYAFSRQERVDIIQYILEYYRLHFPEFPEIKSLEVLQSLFS